MESTMMDYPLTLPHILERAGRYFPKAEIVSRLPDKSMHRTTYGEFHRRARALAAGLRKAGLNQGDRVATLMWNHYVHMEAYFGIPAAGGVLHTLNLRLHHSDLEYIVNNAEDRFLIVDDVLLPVLEQFRPRVNFERIFVVNHSGAPLPAGLESYTDLLASGSGDFVYPKIDEREAAGMCYTSGTTGRPRGVVYSHRSTVLHSYNCALANTMHVTPSDIILLVVPMFHANAWGIPYAAAMMGASIVFPGPYLDGESVLELFERERVTFSAGVPTVWLAVLQLLERDAARWKLTPGLRLAVGGSAAPESMIRAFDKFGITILHAWGMTETSPAATVASLKPHLQRLPEDERYAYRAKQGYPLPFVELRVVGDDGKEVPPDGKTMGEIQVRGPYITAAYFKMGPTAEKFTADGWLRTGDVATLDEEGYIRITDRTKDLIKSGGEWISSVDLENAIMGHPAVAEAAVIAIPHPKWDERPLAIVVLKPGAQATPQDIQNHLAGKFAKWWLPDEYVFTDSIPRTSTGKFLKSALRERYGKRGTSIAAAASNVA
jgi:fatty-acyl-CoA synthase